MRAVIIESNVCVVFMQIIKSTNRTQTVLRHVTRRLQSQEIPACGYGHQSNNKFCRFTVNLPIIF